MGQKGGQPPAPLERQLRLQLETAAPLGQAGGAGYGVWSTASGRYRVRYQHAEPVPGVKLMVLVGRPAVPGFAEQLAPFLVPLLFGGVVLLLVAASVVTLLPGSPAVRALPGSIALARHKPELGGWFVLLVALVVALASWRSWPVSTRGPHRRA